MKVLIIDGSMAIIQRLKDYISEDNGMIEFYNASTGNEALQLITSHLPMVVILDINLPEKHSFKLIKYLKKNHVNIFIIVLSIQPDENMRKQSQNLGVNVFLDKYHEFEKVPGIVKEIYQHWCLEKENLKTSR